MKSEVALFKDKRAASAKEIIACYRFFGFTDKEIVAEMEKIKGLRVSNPPAKVADTLKAVDAAKDYLLDCNKPSNSDVSVTQNIIQRPADPSLEEG